MLDRVVGNVVTGYSLHNGAGLGIVLDEQQLSGDIASTLLHNRLSVYCVEQAACIKGGLVATGHGSEPQFIRVQGMESIIQRGWPRVGALRGPPPFGHCDHGGLRG